MFKFEKAVQRKNSKESLEAKPEEKPVHLIPFHFEKDSEAKVDDFFNSKITEENVTANDGSVIGTNLKASLHGRALKGKEIKLSDKVIGMLNHFYEENGNNIGIGIVYRRELSEKTGVVQYKPEDTFTKFTYWKHDDYPVSRDKVQSAFEYLNVLEAVKIPVL